MMPHSSRFRLSGIARHNCPGSLQRTIMIRALFLGLFLATSLWAQTRELDLQPSDGWVDTGVALNAGDTFEVTATGELQFVGAKTANGPEGLARGFGDLIKAFPVNAAGRGAVIGRIGDNPAARALLIRSHYSGQG